MTREEILNKLKELRDAKYSTDEILLPLSTREMLDEVIRIISVSEPQGLGKAAEEYSKHGTCYANDSHLQKQTTELAFKAGAKWAAEHGVSYDSTVIHGANNMLFVTALLDGKDFKEGDKVTVQIRKK